MTRTQLISKAIEGGKLHFYSDAEAHQLYDESLDDEGEVSVAGMFFQPSDILKNCDETAYRCGFNDWTDGMGWEEHDGGYVETSEVDSYVDEQEESEVQS